MIMLASHAKAASGFHDPSVIKPVNPGQRDQLDAFDATPRLSLVNQFGFVESIDYLR